MTGTASILAKLMADCDTHGIRLFPAGRGGLTIDAPSDSLTPQLISRLKTHKDELIAILLPKPSATDTEEWLEVIDAEGPQVWVRANAADPNYIDPPDPCGACGGIERWQDATDGWHCPTCDPAPGHGARLRVLAERFRTISHNTRTEY